MKYTLLDLVQTIASSMDSDEVNSINDSVESQQIAKVVRTVYFDIINRANLPEHYNLINLEASGTSLKPVLMTIPDDTSQIDWIKYDKSTVDFPNMNMEYVSYLPLREFLERMHSLDLDADNVESFTHTVDANTFTISYINDSAPSYYTSLNDRVLIFDSFDNAVDSSLQKSKSLARAKKTIVFTMSDTFVPDLDEAQFPLLLNEAKSLAWAELRQAAHNKAEQNSRRAWTNVQKSKTASEKLSDFDQLPSFGRK